MVAYAGKPVSGNGPYYVPTVNGAVQSLVEKLEESVSLEGRNISYDRFCNSEFLSIANFRIRCKPIYE